MHEIGDIILSAQPRGRRSPCCWSSRSCRLRAASPASSAFSKRDAAWPAVHRRADRRRRARTSQRVTASSVVSDDRQRSRRAAAACAVRRPRALLRVVRSRQPRAWRRSVVRDQPAPAADARESRARRLGLHFQLSAAAWLMAIGSTCDVDVERGRRRVRLHTGIDQGLQSPAARAADCARRRAPSAARRRARSGGVLCGRALSAGAAVRPSPRRGGLVVAGLVYVGPHRRRASAGRSTHTIAPDRSGVGRPRTWSTTRSRFAQTDGSIADASRPVRRARAVALAGGGWLPSRLTAGTCGQRAPVTPRADATGRGDAACRRWLPVRIAGTSFESVAATVRELSRFRAGPSRRLIRGIASGDAEPSSSRRDGRRRCI